MKTGADASEPWGRGLTDADKDRLTREAMESARAGRTVSHERVRAWVESLATANPLPLPQSSRPEPGA